MANDFRAETAVLGGIGYTVASSTSRATATVDDDGTVTITSVSAGAAVSHAHLHRPLRRRRDQYGGRHSQLGEGP